MRTIVAIDVLNLNLNQTIHWVYYVVEYVF